MFHHQRVFVRDLCTLQCNALKALQCRVFNSPVCSFELGCSNCPDAVVCSAPFPFFVSICERLASLLTFTSKSVISLRQFMCVQFSHGKCSNCPDAGVCSASAPFPLLLTLQQRPCWTNIAGTAAPRVIYGKEGQCTNAAETFRLGFLMKYKLVTKWDIFPCVTRVKEASKIVQQGHICQNISYNKLFLFVKHQRHRAKQKTYANWPG